MGVIDNVARRIPSGWQDDGHNIYLLGTTQDELDGSAWAEAIHSHLGGKPPQVKLEEEKKLASLLHGASLQGLIASAHDLSDGGLAVALIESCLRFGVGARVHIDEILEEGVDETSALFSESQARVIVTVGREDDVKFQALCEARGVAVKRIGVTDADSKLLDVSSFFSLSLIELLASWSSGISKF
jgi:phosphoribosylformylglycinamidine synthase